MKDLTLVERACVLRITRRARTEMLHEHERMKELGMRGDKVADAAARTLDAEITILDAAVKKIWDDMCETRPTEPTGGELLPPAEPSG